MQPVRVLVVDDSSLMRRLITRLLETDKEIKVIGTATDGLDAIDKVKVLRPDAVSMDVEMPKLDGLATLRRVMKEHPVPVIMLSALTTEGARATMEALAAGAVDFVPKPLRSTDINRMTQDLATKLKVAARVSMRKVARPLLINRVTAPLSMPAPAGNSTPVKGSGKTELVVIGSSTGGPAALQHIVPFLPANLKAAVVIVQHIPAGFSKSMAEHLNRKSQIAVKHAEAGDIIRPGQVLVAPAGYEFTFRNNGGNKTVSLDKFGQPIPPGGFRPSVDVVMHSAAQVYADRVMGVLLTGMGRDGSQGLLSIRQMGGRTIAEHESTCVVYGMPKAAVELGAAEKVVPLPQIAAEIQRLL